jgi:hypothetical protein
MKVKRSKKYFKYMIRQHDDSREGDERSTMDWHVEFPSRLLSVGDV